MLFFDKKIKNNNRVIISILKKVIGPIKKWSEDEARCIFNEI